MKYIQTILFLAIFAGYGMSVLAAPTKHHAPIKKQEVVKHKSLKTLPKGHHSITFQNKPYYFNAGKWYQKSKGLYVGIRAPIGAVIAGLPIGYLTVAIGSNRYYHLDGVYYRRGNSGYIVVEDPYIHANPDTGVQEDPTRLMVYPAAGQDKEQISREKFECYEWASTESRYDPVNSESDPEFQADYRRAMIACLEAKNYVVK